MFRMIKILMIGLLFSSAAWADRDDWSGYHHGHHHGYGYYGYPGDVIYAPQAIVEYVPRPVVQYVPVQPRNYAPLPPIGYYGYDHRSPQGLVGGMIGSAMGYELGRGDPLAAGIGAVAGAWLGNGRF